jgi:hypothetical protein
MPAAAKRPPKKKQTAHRVADAIGQPIALSIAKSAVRIGVSYSTIYKAVAKDVFTVIAPLGRGEGKPVSLYVDEVDAFLHGRDEAVIALRIKLGRLKARK